jgi:DeoR/GlpR family transcriptional regulator of sugar metabolism
MQKKEFVEERRDELLAYINENKRANVEDLAQKFNVTDVTIRRDLIILEQQEKLVRTHGGAMCLQDKSVWQTTSLDARMADAAEEKTKIAEYIAGIIKDGESLFIDGGSTTYLTAKALLKRKRLLVVTNSPSIAELLAGTNDNKVILTGGELQKETDSITGTSCENDIRQYRTDKAILGMSGVVVQDGFFAAIPQEASIKRLMSLNSKYTIVAVDSTKMGVTAFNFVCDIKTVDLIVTDTKISDADMRILTERGAKVTTV